MPDDDPGIVPGSRATHYRLAALAGPSHLVARVLPAILQQQGVVLAHFLLLSACAFPMYCSCSTSEVILLMQYLFGIAD